MAAPRLTPEQITQVSGLVSQYISTQEEEIRTPCSPVAGAAEGCHERVFLAASSGRRPTFDAAKRAGCQPRFLPDVERFGLQQSARSIDDGSDYVLRRCGFTRTILEWAVISRAHLRGTVSATRRPAFFRTLCARVSERRQLRGDSLGGQCVHAGGRFEQNPARQFSVAEKQSGEDFPALLDELRTFLGPEKPGQVVKPIPGQGSNVPITLTATLRTTYGLDIP